MNGVYVSIPENIDTYFDDISEPFDLHYAGADVTQSLLDSGRPHNLSSSFWKSNIILSDICRTRSSVLQGNAFDNLDKTTIFD